MFDPSGIPRVMGGSTGKTIADAFIHLDLSGAADVVAKLKEMAANVNMDANPRIQGALSAAADVIGRAYKKNVHDVTGNLRRSVRKKKGKYENAAVVIVGPQQTGAMGGDRSGNHAWLVEFGTGRRKPGSNARHTYINVHKAINMKMTRAGSFNNKQFENMGKGTYFLMSSINEQSRQNGRGRGYPHDFLPDDEGGIRPMTLGPGETYGEMPASHAMEAAINSSGQEALNVLINGIKAEIEALS